MSTNKQAWKQLAEKSAAWPIPRQLARFRACIHEARAAVSEAASLGQHISAASSVGVLTCQEAKDFSDAVLLDLKGLQASLINLFCGQCTEHERLTMLRCIFYPAYVAGSGGELDIHLDQLRHGETPKQLEEIQLHFLRELLRFVDGAENPPVGQPHSE